MIGVYNCVSCSIVAVVGFEQTNYTVAEGEGVSSEVCVAVSVPAADEELGFEIPLQLDTLPGTASGKQWLIVAEQLVWLVW